MKGNSLSAPVFDKSFYILNHESAAPVSGLTAIDLFSGAGGISLGIQNAGFKILFASDIDDDCRKTHEHNFPSTPFFCGDVADLSAKKIMDVTGLAKGELDLLVGGPPCQGFSIIGARAGDDPRNRLFLEFMRVAKELKPKAIVIENVPGLSTFEKGKVLSAIADAYDKAGYTFGCSELLAAHYGVPQMRWRMIMIGWRKDLKISEAGFPEFTHGTKGAFDLRPNKSIPPSYLKGFITTGDAIRDLPPVGSGEEVNNYIGKPDRPYQQAMRVGLSSELFNHYAPKLSEANIARINALKPGQDWRDLPIDLLPAGMQRALRKDHTRRFRRMTWDGIPRSIITRFRDPKSGEYSHPNQSRTISIREAARIQSFPDWFRFFGGNTKQYDQVGNAVPPLMARAIGIEIAEVLLGKKSRKLGNQKSKTATLELQTSFFTDSF